MKLDSTETIKLFYYLPIFEFVNDLPINTSAWSGHYFFAYDLVRNTKPKVIVELGTHKGNSLFSMAQAIKDSKLNTKLYGIDTWEGDPQAGYYGEDIYKEFLKISKKYYKDVNIIPLKMLFDNALKEFKDNSIDILHIDGLHTYEAVKHDFDTWLPKVKKDTGIIMFHDVCETKDDFGVYKLWDELKKRYKNTITFEHYHGLGVIFLNQDLELSENNLVSYYTTLSNNQDAGYAIEQLQEKNNLLEEELSEMHKTMGKMHDNLVEFKTKEKTWEDKENIWKEKEKVMNEYKKEVEEFRAFKQGRIWKVLSQYRRLKRTFSNR
ncbi:MAG TPA: class I SAM-dependent methyltransferase [Candidatus Dojkabacteria bacterium]|nr:class I SAM-dependent methyltransferase [Candidatus Dojkabacteria bacterium]